jgi:hypothetical protein
MRARGFTLIVGIVAIAACSRTESGDVVVKRPSRIDIQTTTDTIRVPSVKTRSETVDAPVVGTQPETVIVKKPVVVGKQKKVIQVPSLQQKP